MSLPQLFTVKTDFAVFFYGFCHFFTPRQKKSGKFFPNVLGFYLLTNKNQRRTSRCISHSLFSWQALDESNDIFRFRKLLEALDDKELIRRLKAERKGRRNDYPIEAIWNSLLARLLFNHSSIQSLRRELRRNTEFRQVCGFDPLLKEKAVPSKDAYHRFQKKLDNPSDLLLDIFHQLLRKLFKFLPDLGKRLAADGKAIPACRKDDRDAVVGCKKEISSKGEREIVTYEWFGYKLHLLCDATYELPVAFDVTTATAHESPRLLKMIQDLKENHEDILSCAETLASDKGYDDGEDKERLYQEYDVIPIIPARDMAQGEYKPLDPERHDTLYISPTGQIACKNRPFESDEKKRGTLKFRRPSAAWGIECQNRDSCRCSRKAKHSEYGRVVRVKVNSFSRLLSPIYPHSYRFEDIYKSRTAVERLFARLDHQYGIERHYDRGMRRMRTRVTMSLIAMLATALGWIKSGRAENMRRLFQAA